MSWVIRRAAGADRPVREVVDRSGIRIRLDLSRQVLRVAALPDYDLGGDEGQSEVLLSSTLRDLAEPEFMSAAMLAAKAKQVDDGVYAAVEIAAERGAGRFRGKTALLAGLAAALANECGQPVEVVQAAAKLGGLSVYLPEPIGRAVDRRIDAFLGDDLLSKPIGFYTWNADLAAIFRQDRMLQQTLEPEDVAGIVNALAADPPLSASYTSALELAERLTNPLAYGDLRPLIAGETVCDTPICFLPPSRAQELDFAKKLYGDRPIPDGFSLVDELIGRVRAGTVSLAPTAASGWYDHQSFALEPLVLPEKMPEARRVIYNEAYCGMLVDLFKGLLMAVRETHIKQLEILKLGAGGTFRGAPQESVFIKPDLPAETLVTHYYRRALAYRFVRGVLEEEFGVDGLASMQRLTATGRVAKPLLAELTDMEGLCYGAHVAVARALGMTPEAGAVGSGRGAEADAASFSAWVKSLADDPDLSRDMRTMVPIFYDVRRKLVKVWVFLGWATRRIEISYDREPAVVGIEDAGGKPVAHPPAIVFRGQQRMVSYPVTAEVYVTKVLDREEFRELCDQGRTRSGILALLR